MVPALRNCSTIAARSHVRVSFDQPACTTAVGAVDLLLGDSSKARPKLGWTPRTSFAQLVDTMVEGDLELARQEAVLNGPPASGKKLA
jgi:GDP-D-mannose dehydratase